MCMLQCAHNLHVAHRKHATGVISDLLGAHAISCALMTYLAVPTVSIYVGYGCVFNTCTCVMCGICVLQLFLYRFTGVLCIHNRWTLIITLILSFIPSFILLHFTHMHATFLVPLNIFTFISLSDIAAWFIHQWTICSHHHHCLQWSGAQHNVMVNSIVLATFHHRVRIKYWRRTRKQRLLLAASLMQQDH